MTEVQRPPEAGSQFLRLSSAEIKEVILFTIRWMLGALLAVGGIWLTSVDLGQWSVLLLPLGAGLTKASSKFFQDTRPNDGWGPVNDNVPPPSPPRPDPTFPQW